MGKDYEAGVIVCAACGLTLIGGAHLHQDCLPDLCRMRALHLDHGDEREPGPTRTTSRITIPATTSSATATFTGFTWSIGGSRS